MMINITFGDTSKSNRFNAPTQPKQYNSQGGNNGKGYMGVLSS